MHAHRLIAFTVFGCALTGAGARPAVPGGPVTAAIGISEAIAGLQGRYASVTTVRADFEQTYRAPGISQRESGRLFMKKPGLMRWEYLEPEVKLFIADGKESYLYTPEERQVLVSRLSAEELRSTPLQFLLGRGNILASFAASWETELKPRLQATLMLRLTPLRPDPMYSYLVIECDERTFELRRLVIREETGNTSEFLFTNLETNVTIDDAKMQFKVPKGVEVIRMDVK
jgi:outer membrane lipoprotein carrier protein